MSKAHEELMGILREVLFGCAVLAVFSIVLAAITANAAEKYVVNAFVAETTECSFSREEERTIETLRNLIQEKADLHVSRITIEGKVKQLNFSDFRKKGAKTGKKVVTVALFPEKSGMPHVTYIVDGGFFVAATPKRALSLLKKYL